MDSIYIVGHKNPDTDSIATAIGLSKFISNSIPVRLGEINLETKFVLDFLGVKSPIMVENLEGKEVIIIDHSERTQTLEDINKAKVIAIIDHHKINFTTNTPIIYLSKPVGCTATIIGELYYIGAMSIIGGDNGIKMDRETALLLLSAIISDTLIFKSPTTTKLDVEIANKLLSVTEIVDVEDYGMQMLEAKSNLSNFLPIDLLGIDCKDFIMSGKKVRISQIETVCINQVVSKVDEVLSIMVKDYTNCNLDLYLFIITDVIKDGSYLYYCGDKRVIEKSFGVNADKNGIYIPKLVSRKKQIVPPLEVFYAYE